LVTVKTGKAAITEYSTSSYISVWSGGIGGTRGGGVLWQSLNNLFHSGNFQRGHKRRGTVVLQ